MRQNGKQAGGLGAFGGAALLGMGVLAAAIPAQATSLWENSVMLPRSGFFAGLGIGVTAVDFGHQSLYAIGTAHTEAGGQLISIGTTAGAGSTDPATVVSPDPAVRLGYYRHFGDSHWLWGFRVSYEDLLASQTENNVAIPESGAYAVLPSQTIVPATGVALVQHYKVTADSRFGAMPFIGRDFGPGFLYLGLGGVMTHVSTALNGLVGYTSMNGQMDNDSGAPKDVSSAGWVLGAGVTLGGTYFLTHDWFLDIAYSFDETAAQLAPYVAGFINSTPQRGETTSGSLIAHSAERIVTQGVTLSINRHF